MDFMEIVRSRRTIRFFKQEPIAEDVLSELVEAARRAPSASNGQPLEYVIVNDKGQVERVFEQLAWGAYVQPRRDPPAGRRPVAYIVVLINSEWELGRFGVVDAAAAIENILLAAWSKGIGSCWLASVKRQSAAEILDIPEQCRIDSVVALGYPDETPLLEECTSESIEYYLDDDDRLHVPKRPLKKITHVNTFGCLLGAKKYRAGLTQANSPGLYSMKRCRSAT